MKVSCVLLNYNDASTTIKLIQMIRDYQVFHSIVVVDNCSTDGSFEKLKKYQDDKVHVITTLKNGGYGSGNNYGARYAYEKLGATYILISNPDVEFSEQCVKDLVSELSSDESCAAVAPLMRNVDGRISPYSAWKFPTMLEDVLSSSTLINKFFVNKHTYSIEENEFEDAYYVDIIPGSLLMVKAKIMLDFGMYDEEFFLYGEEKLLAHKFIRAGFKTKLLPYQSYLHIHSVSIDKSIKSTTQKHKMILNSKRMFWKKYYGLRGGRLLLTEIFFKITILENIVITKLSQIKKRLNTGGL